MALVYHKNTSLQSPLFRHYAGTRLSLFSDPQNLRRLVIRLDPHADPHKKSSL